MKAEKSPPEHTLVLPADGQVAFISDVHLGFGGRYEDRDREVLLVSLLRKLRRDVQQVVLLGDIFDAWFDYKTVIPKTHFRLLSELGELILAGIPVTYLIGNHDFGHYAFFEQELGIIPLESDLVLNVNNVRFYLSHGDGKLNNDRGYLMLRAVLRNKLSRTLYRWLHPDIGIGLATRTSGTSRTYTDKKDYGEADALRDFALAMLKRGYDYVVMGHRHKAEIYQAEYGNYVNLGHWLNRSPTFGLFNLANATFTLPVVHDFVADIGRDTHRPLRV